jgi:MFS family permease
MVEHARALSDTLALLRQPAFRRLWLAQAVSEVGDWLTNVALMLLLYQLLGHPGAAALVLLAKLLPRVVVYPFSGLLADRLDRSRLMRWTCLVRAGLVLSLLLAQTPETVWWVLLATALSQALASLFNPAALAIVPAVAPARWLARPG